METSLFGFGSSGVMETSLFGFGFGPHTVLQVRGSYKCGAGVGEGESCVECLCAKATSGSLQLIFATDSCMAIAGVETLPRARALKTCEYHLLGPCINKTNQKLSGLPSITASAFVLTPRVH